MTDMKALIQCVECGGPRVNRDGSKALQYDHTSDCPTQAGVRKFAALFAAAPAVSPSEAETATFGAHVTVRQGQANTTLNIPAPAAASPVEREATTAAKFERLLDAYVQSEQVLSHNAAVHDAECDDDQEPTPDIHEARNAEERDRRRAALLGFLRAALPAEPARTPSTLPTYNAAWSWIFDNAPDYVKAYVDALAWVEPARTREETPVAWAVFDDCGVMFGKPEYTAEVATRYRDYLQRGALKKGFTVEPLFRARRHDTTREG